MANERGPGRVTYWSSRSAEGRSARRSHGGHAWEGGRLPRRANSGSDLRWWAASRIAPQWRRLGFRPSDGGDLATCSVVPEQAAEKGPASLRAAAAAGGGALVALGHLPAAPEVGNGRCGRGRRIPSILIVCGGQPKGGGLLDLTAATWGCTESCAAGGSGSASTRAEAGRSGQGPVLGGIRNVAGALGAVRHGWRPRRAVRALRLAVGSMRECVRTGGKHAKSPSAP